MVRFPVCAVAAVGVKRTVTDALAPAAIVSDEPTAANCGLSLVIELTTSAPVPLFVIVTVKSLGWPIVTVPNARAAGDTPIEGVDGTTPVVPLPVRLTGTLARAGSLLASNRVPETG